MGPFLARCLTKCVRFLGQTLWGVLGAECHEADAKMQHTKIWDSITLRESNGQIYSIYMIAAIDLDNNREKHNTITKRPKNVHASIYSSNRDTTHVTRHKSPRARVSAPRGETGLWAANTAHATSLQISTRIYSTRRRQLCSSRLRWGLPGITRRPA